jgi:hypothetical protein
MVTAARWSNPLMANIETTLKVNAVTYKACKCHCQIKDPEGIS